MRNLRPELVAKCIELLYAQSANGYTSSVVTGSVLGALYWPVASHGVILGWAFAYGAMIGLRYLLGRRFALVHVTPSNERKWLGLFGAAILVCGVLWGAFAVYLVSFDDPDRRAAVVIAIGALVSGAVTAYSVSTPVLLSFTVPAMLPLGLVMLAKGEPGSVLLGALIIAWLGFMLATASRFRGFIVESLDLQFENAQLVGSLEEERDRVTELARQLKMLSSTDPLTGLANRRAFDEALEEAWARGAAHGSPLAYVTADVDHFKAYNDLYGHPQGDEALRRVADALSREAMRCGGVAARLGGEEFALLVPDCDAERAYLVAERVRSAIAALAMPHRGSALGHVTASFGTASAIPSRTLAMTSLGEAADRALYDAKRTGRNRTAVPN